MCRACYPSAYRSSGIASFSIQRLNHTLSGPISQGVASMPSLHRGGVTFIVTYLMLTSPALGQEATSATVVGVVRDTSGAVLPGVTVEVTSPALIERVKTATTDSD